MYRHTDDRKVWYEWIVEVFCWEKRAAVPQHRQHGSTSQSPSGLASSVDERSGSETGKGKLKGRGREAQSGGADGSGANTPEPSSGMKKVRVGMSELHSSIKEGCLMWNDLYARLKFTVYMTFFGKQDIITLFVPGNMV